VTYKNELLAVQKILADLKYQEGTRELNRGPEGYGNAIKAYAKVLEYDDTHVCALYYWAAILETQRKSGAIEKYKAVKAQGRILCRLTPEEGAIYHIASYKCWHDQAVQTWKPDSLVEEYIAQRQRQLQAIIVALEAVEPREKFLEQCLEEVRTKLSWSLSQVIDTLPKGSDMRTAFFEHQHDTLKSSTVVPALAAVVVTPLRDLRDGGVRARTASNNERRVEDTCQN
jgi:hypothetical protein